MAAEIEFDWDEENQKHLERHAVSPEEFEQVIGNDPLDLEYQTETGEERYKSLGLTDRGRILVVVWTIRDGKIRAITAYPARKSPGTTVLGDKTMKRDPKVKRTVPTFASEAEEAKWWYQNRRKLDKELLAAARSGQLKPLKRRNLAARIARSKAAKVISIRLAEADLEMARSQAARQGLPYQTYIKSLLHQALAQQAKNR